MSLFLALNRRPRHGKARQVLGEDRSRQPVVGAAESDPERPFATVNYCIAKGLFEGLIKPVIHAITNLRGQHKTELPQRRTIDAECELRHASHR